MYKNCENPIKAARWIDLVGSYAEYCDEFENTSAENHKNENDVFDKDTIVVTLNMSELIRHGKILVSTWQKSKWCIPWGSMIMWEQPCYHPSARLTMSDFCKCVEECMEALLSVTNDTNKNG